MVMGVYVLKFRNYVHLVNKYIPINNAHTLLGWDVYHMYSDVPYINSHTRTYTKYMLLCIVKTCMHVCIKFTIIMIPRLPQMSCPSNWMYDTSLTVEYCLYIAKFPHCRSSSACTMENFVIWKQYVLYSYSEVSYIQLEEHGIWSNPGYHTSWCSD